MRPSLPLRPILNSRHPKQLINHRHNLGLHHRQMISWSIDEAEIRVEGSELLGIDQVIWEGPDDARNHLSACQAADAGLDADSLDVDGLVVELCDLLGVGNLGPGSVAILGWWWVILPSLLVRGGSFSRLLILCAQIRYLLDLNAKGADGFNGMGRHAAERPAISLVEMVLLIGFIKLLHDLWVDYLVAT